VAWAEWVVWISRPLRGPVDDMKARVKITRAFCPRSLKGAKIQSVMPHDDKRDAVRRVPAGSAIIAQLASKVRI
jgi:hypothetical protein